MRGQRSLLRRQIQKRPAQSGSDGTKPKPKAAGLAQKTRAATVKRRAKGRRYKSNGKGSR
jgi:hypothetical protein